MPRKTDPDKPKAPRKPRAPRVKKSANPRLPPGPPAEPVPDPPEDALDAVPPAPRRRRIATVIAFVLAILVMTGVGALVAGHRWLMAWAARPYGPVSKTIEVKINPGTPFLEASAQLETQGLISEKALFRALAVLERKEGKIQAGVYRIKAPVTPRELLERLQRGSFESRITMPEGWTARQMDEYLFEHNWIGARGEWERVVAQPVGAEVLGEELARGAEGFCFPDSYMLERGTTPDQIRGRMLRRFAEVWGELGAGARDPRSEGLTMLQVVTLASIVERETRKPEELPRVASVFLNRLAGRMKLQSCATVHYALGEVWNRPLTHDDLKTESAFNTYRITGLPPAPIGSPGRGAIEAVLRPAPTEDLYFVHRGDGTHEFTKSYREHQKAARKFRRTDPNASLAGE